MLRKSAGLTDPGANSVLPLDLDKARNSPRGEADRVSSALRLEAGIAKSVPSYGVN